jgi:hypothetical protein
MDKQPGPPCPVRYRLSSYNTEGNGRNSQATGQIDCQQRPALPQRT